MTREETINMLERLRFPDPWEPKLSKGAEEALDIAISVLSAEGAYIKKEDALSCFTWQNTKKDAWLAIKDLPAYSFPNSDENKGEWIDNGNGSYTCSNCKTEWTTSQIEKMCFCPTCGADMRGGK